ncbi:hypothetical protein NMS_0977 [Nonlabens marinus S1-08]|uniref:Uncharacterized protein n=1 Tax=Nonlabens marinus S1-08 TaxID=1454201 RepID=W8VZQ5_9FLAO|nr:hypothetical protein NMS_0977 [Nonlabens marinus S1-08]
MEKKIRFRRLFLYNFIALKIAIIAPVFAGTSSRKFKTGLISLSRKRNYLQHQNV